jgi:MFS family permease
MYALSPGVGWLTDRAGALPVIVAGGVILIIAAEVAAASSPHDHAQIFGGLFLLGLGWNFELVASSSILTTAVTPERRVAAQGATDLLMNSFGAAAGIGAGFVIGLQGFDVLGHAGAAVACMVVAAGVVGLVIGRGLRAAPSI